MSQCNQTIYRREIVSVLMFLGHLNRTLVYTQLLLMSWFLSGDQSRNGLVSNLLTLSTCDNIRNKQVSCCTISCVRALTSVQKTWGLRWWGRGWCFRKMPVTLSLSFKLLLFGEGDPSQLIKHRYDPSCLKFEGSGMNFSALHSTQTPTCSLLHGLISTQGTASVYIMKCNPVMCQ